MRDRGTFNFSGNLEVKKDAPLEARSLVNSYADLVKPETWTDEQGGIWKYDCMLVSCKDRPGEVYQLSPGADYTKESSWILIGDTSELNNKVQEFIDSKGAPNGLASLNESGIIPSAQLPSYVDDVIEVDTFSNLPGTGESGKIYIVQDTNLTYRWSGTAYVEISKSLALGETSSTAYPGDKGKATTDKLNKTSDKVVVGPTTVNPSTDKIVLKYQTHFTSTNSDSEDSHTINAATTSQAGLMSSSDKTKLDGLKDQAGITSDINAVQTNLETHINNKSNPHKVTKDQVGLGNVDNTSDKDKPLSDAAKEAINEVKTLITSSGTDLSNHIKDYTNPHRVTAEQVGLGNVNNTSDLDKPISNATQKELDKLDAKIDKINTDQGTDLSAHLRDFSNPHKVTKEQIGLGNVDNTADLDKPISTATQKAIDDAKAANNTALDNHANRTDNPHKVTKDQVGLGNVDNTSDANKPISNATQTALNGKFSATDGNALKQTIEDMPNLVVTEGSVSHKNNNISLSLRQRDLKDPANTDSILLTFNSATASKAGILVPTDKSKIDKIITNGNGTKYLSDNGNYKEVSGGGGSNIYVFSPTISGNGISEQDYNNFKAAAKEGKVILVPNTLHNRKIGGQFVPINYYGTSNFVLSYIRPLEEADGTFVSDLCMVYIYNTYEIGGTEVRITNAKNLIIPNVNTILRPVSLQGQDAQSKINELFSSAGNFKDVIEDILVNHTRYYFHFDNKLTNCIELGCVNAWRNDEKTSYELHFIVVYNTNNTYYTSKVSVIYNTDINNTKYHVTNLVQSDNISSAYVLNKSRDNRKSVSLVGEGFDENHWYPVSFTADPNSIVPPCNLIIWNSLNNDSAGISPKPSWATNNGGFVLHIDMTIIGNGYGQYTYARNKLNNWHGEWGGETAVGEMRQTTQTSTFYIYLRGGANYFYTSDYADLKMIAHSSEVLDGYNTYSIKDTQGDIKDFFTYVENDLFGEVKNLQIVHTNEFNFANDNIGDYVWINYRSRYDAVTSAKAIYIGNGQAGADGAYGAVHASGFFKESDIRLKSDIAPLKHTLDQICNIPTVEFNMHDKHQIGTIAQDLENNFAEVVNTDSDGMKSVDYCMLGVVAIEGIKLLKQEVEDLKKQIEELKNGK